DDRAWVEHLSVLPAAMIDEESGAWSVSPVRDWSYEPSGPLRRDRTAAQFSPIDVQRIWFVVEPHPSLERYMAHTLVLLELPGDRLIGLTIEARRETHEGYSAFGGLWNTYELAYIWASAKDLLTRRAVYLDHAIHIYPIDITDTQREDFVERLLEKTRALGETPRFYNTLFSNCTNELAKTAGLDWSPAFVLTGLSAQQLFKEGVVPGDSFDAVDDQSDLTAPIIELNDQTSATFDVALLLELRDRFAAILDN
ncbi:MAG: DUF4105 domain-containing protein, partial [Pseudomonadota bacterium]